MTALFIALLAALRTTIRSRLELAPKFSRSSINSRCSNGHPETAAPSSDRSAGLGVALKRLAELRQAMQIVTPAPSCGGIGARSLPMALEIATRRVGRPALAPDLQALIRQMRDANPLWGAPRIHGELQKLGIEVAQATVAKYLGSRRDPPSQSWRTFLTNHLSQLASIDFFTVPTATFRVLFVFVVLSHDRRPHCPRECHGASDRGVDRTTAPRSVAVDTAPRFVIRDRDAIYGSDARRTVQQMGIEEVLTAPRCPWQNPFVERVIGSLRRECLDHVIVLNERSLQRHLQRYLAYYHDWRTHLSLDKDTPSRE